MDNKAYHLALRLMIESYEDRARMPLVPQANIKYFQGTADAYSIAAHKVCITFGLNYPEIRQAALDQLKQAE